MESLMIDKMIDILGQEARIYASILEMSRNKTNIIVEGKVSELENIVKLEQSLILQIGRLEGMREELVEQISNQLDLAPENITISGLVKHLKDSQAEKLKLCQDNMQKVLGNLKNANEMNSRLIKNSLDYIDFSLNLIAAADAGSNNYGNTGEVSGSKKRSFFDMRL